MGYSSPVQSEIMADLELSTADYSLFGSMLTLGGLLGSLVCGKLTDCISRKGAMGLSNILFLIGWFVIALSKGVWSLDLGRLVTGFASGLTVYVVPIYIAEITPRNLRGGYVLLQQLMLCSGIALSFIAGLVTTWRILALIGAFPCMIHLLGLGFIPESPRWLVKVGRDQRYEAILQSLRGKDVDISLEASEIKEYIDAVNNISEDGLLHIFQRKYAFALIIILGLVVLTPFTGTNGMLFYASTIFESAGASATVGTVTMALIQLPLILLGVFLMDNYGRKPILLGSVFGMFIGCLSVAVSFFLKEHELLTKYSPYLAFTGILVYGATYPVGMGGIPYVIMSEIFPMNVKGAAGSLATTASGCCGWIVSYTFNFMMDWSSSEKQLCNS
ncbi:sugar transporter ERD6-like 5 isoform X2 [Silene latifolia]|uniref:sugar transporter ERD6-like 5 isoform X2 n=1 Tax=Silene latifolia TaxID=37657 RepID=UPI003D77A9EF